MSKEHGLTERIIHHAVLLVLIASVLSAGFGNLISRYFVAQRSEQINQLVLDAVTNKANEALVAIEQAINAVLKLPEMEQLFSSEPDNFYRQTILKMKIERDLSDILMYKDAIDGMYISTDGLQIKISNTSLLDFYQFERSQALEEIRALLLSERRRSFSLYDYQQSHTDFFCIVYPVWNNQSDTLKAVMVIMLSKSFAEQLDLKSDTIIMKDGIHTSAPLSEQEQSTLSSAPLNWEGWSVLYRASNQALRNAQEMLLLYSLLLCVVLSLAALAAASGFARRYLAPVGSLSRQIEAIAGDDAHRRIHLRTRGSLHAKLLRFFALLVLVTLVLIIGLVYWHTQRMVDSEVGSELETNTRLMRKQTELMLTRERSLMRSIVMDESVQAFMRSASAQAEQALEQTLKKFVVDNRSIQNIAFYAPTGDLLYASSFRETLLIETDANADIATLQEGNALYLYRVIPRHLFNSINYRLGMHVFSLSPNPEGGNLLGYILLDVDADKSIHSLFQHSLYPTAEVYLLDGAGVDLLAKTHQQDAPDAAGFRMVEGATQQTVEGKHYYVSYQTVAPFGWRLLMTIPWQTYTVQRNHFLLLLLGVFLVLLPSVWSIAYMLSRLLLRDVAQLIETSRHVSQGNLSKRYQEKSNTSELGILAQSFNDMLDSLQTANDAKLASEMQAKDAVIHARELELHLLQAQIKPHFLYNTLRTIQYMAMMKDPSAVQMLGLLITLFRMGINQNDEIVTVQEELRHVEAYFEIQRIRFSGQINKTVDIPEEMTTQPMLKLLLQPIVENAIGHGIRERDGSGHIRIIGRMTEHSMWFEISDDGIGMEPGKLAELNQALQSSDQRQSIGLFNVNERVKLRYGLQYGLTLTSIYHQGTTVRLVLPRIQPNEHPMPAETVTP